MSLDGRGHAASAIAGGGGIGATLNTAFDRYEFDAAAILLVIIATVVASEWISAKVRHAII